MLVHWHITVHRHQLFNWLTRRTLSLQQHCISLMTVNNVLWDSFLRNYVQLMWPTQHMIGVASNISSSPLSTNYLCSEYDPVYQPQAACNSFSQQKSSCADWVLVRLLTHLRLIKYCGQCPITLNGACLIWFGGHEIYCWCPSEKY